VLKEIIIAISAYGKAHDVIRKHKLWKWIIIPGIIYMVLFVTGFYLYAATGKKLVGEPLLDALGISAWLVKMDSGLLSFIFSFTGLVVWLVGLLFYFSLFKYLWLIAGSPVFAWLSEKTESLVNDSEHAFSLSQWFKDMKRGIGLAGRNMLWQSVYFMALLILSLVPLVGWVVPFFALLIEAYFFGFSMLDYSFERRGTGVTGSMRYVAGHKGLAIGNGLIFYMMHLVPVVGWILAPAYAVVAATLTVVED
jgi:CysZ protein